MLIFRLNNGYCKRGEYPDEYKAIIEQLRQCIKSLPRGVGPVFAETTDSQMIRLHDDTSSVIEVGRDNISLTISGDTADNLTLAASAVKSMELKKFFLLVQEYDLDTNPTTKKTEDEGGEEVAESTDSP